MPTCTLEIELGQGVVAAGSAVTGVVVVTAETSVVCRELVVRLAWVRHGRIARRAEVVAAEVLFDGAWPPGVHRLAFSLPLPAAPLTAATDVFKVDWEVTAVAECAHGDDPRITAPLVVVRDPARPGQRADAGEPPPEVLPQRVGAFLLGLMFLGLGAAVAYVAGLLFFGGFAIAGVGVVVGLGFAGLGALQLWEQFAADRRRGRLSTFSVDVPDDWVGPGRTLEVSVNVASRRPEQLLGVAVSLVHRGEVVIRKPDRSIERVGCRTVADRVEAWSALGVGPGRPAVTTVGLRVPPDAAPTFYSGACTMEWLLVLEAEFGDTHEQVTEEVRLRVG